MFFSRSAGSKYLDRGDIAALDYTQATLTQDGAWHSLDISSIVGAGRRLVLLRVRVLDGEVGKKGAFKTNGDVNAVNSSEIYTHVANVINEADMWVFTDTAGIIEYLFSNVVFTSILVAVRGWFKQ